MADPIPFINRETELALVDAAISEWGTRRFIYFHAPGGVGKTRLLREIYERHRYGRAEAPWAQLTPLTVMVVHEFTQTAWSRQFSAGLQRAARQFGVRLLEKDAGFDSERLMTLLAQTPEEKPDVLIIRLGSDERLRPVLNAVAAAGIKILTLDNFLPRLEGVACRVVTDEIEDAQQMLEMLIQDIGARGKVLALGLDSPGLPANRRAFLVSALAQYPDVELLQALLSPVPDMVEAARQATLDWIRRHPDVKAIWVTWDQYMQGVLEALATLGRSDIGVYSFDLFSSLDERVRAADSPWRATLVIEPTQVGQEMVRLAVRAAHGDPLPAHHTIPMSVVTRETLSVQWPLTDTAPQWLVTSIIDFDEEIHRDFLGLALALATALGREHFTGFLQKTEQFYRLQWAMPDEVQHYQRTELESAFVQCLAAITQRQRVVILLDTVEKAGRAIAYLLESLTKIHNLVVVMAGRPEKLAYEAPLVPFEALIESRAVLPLAVENQKVYLDKKQEQLHTFFPPVFAANLLRLTRGIPILIDLAVESCSSQPLPTWLLQWLTTENPSEVPLEQQQHAFEEQLVRHIVNPRGPLEWLILTMAYVYPLNASLVQHLLGWSPELSVDWLARARHQVFVKALPGERYSLHDEMRRMVRAYAWPEVDAEQAMRLELSRKTLAYLEAQIAALEQQLRQQSQVADDMRYQTLSQQAELLWSLKGMKLYHLLKVDISRGVRWFMEIFTQATERYEYDRRRNWVKMFEESAIGDEVTFLHLLTPEQRNTVWLCKAKMLLDDKRYEEAVQTLDQIVVPAMPVEQQVDWAIQKANVTIRLGDFQTGIDFFEQAVALSQSLAETHPRLRVKAMNGLGWAYRLVAELDQAQRYYEQALELAQAHHMVLEQAALCSNLGFVLIYQTDTPRHKDLALGYCLEGLRLAQQREQQVGDKRAVGRAYSTLGCVSFIAGQITAALDYFQKALDIFEPAQDYEWLSVVYSWRGATLIAGSGADWTAAERDLQRARSLGIPKEQPAILSRLCLIHLLQGKIELAEQEAQACREIALRLPDPWYQWVSLRDLARVARHKQDYAKLDELESLMQAHLQKWPHPDRRAWGMLCLELGCLALGREELARALDYWETGIKILSLLGQYGRDTPPVHLERLQEFFLKTLQLPAVQIRTLGAQLLQRWQAQKLHIIYPDIRAILMRWASWEEGDHAN